MATQTRTKPAATSNKTGTVTYTQSLELVKTLIFVSASVVTIGRSIFSERHYDKRKFDPTEMKETFSLNRFLDQEPVDERKAIRLKQNKGVWTLNRGTSDKADKFLVMLDKYVFEGIRLKVLEAFELQIYENPQLREEVMERWTFQISYPDDGNDPQLGIQLRRQGQDTVKITDAQDRLRDTIRSIGELANHMIHLPSERHLGMILQYKDDCDPQHIMAEDTEPCEADSIRFPSAEYYDVRSSELCGYSDGKHKIQVSTTYVESVLADRTIGVDDVPDPIRKYDQQEVKGSDTEQIGSTFGGQYVESSQSPQQHIQSPQSLGGLGSPSLIRLGSHMPGDTNANMTYDGHRLTPKESPGETNPRVETETQCNASSLSAADGQQLRSQDAEDSLSDPDQNTSLSMSQQSRMSVQIVDDGVAQRLQGMVQTVRQPDEIVSNTQLRLEQSEMPPPRRVASDILSTDGTVAGPIVDPGSYTLPAAATVRPLRLSEDTLELLERRKPSAQESATRATRSKLRASQNNNTHDVRCECKTTQGDPDMLECHCCEKRQHIRCYGYHGVDDSRIASPHACYTCLVGEKDKRLLRDLEHLAQNRRVISLGQSEGIVSIALLKNRFGLDTKSAQETTNAMVHDGLLVLKASAGSTRTKTAKEWTVSLVPEQGPVTKAAREIFDPSAHIAHLFDEGSMALIEPLTSLYGAMATDPLVRSSSIGNMSRLGRPQISVMAAALDDHNNGRALRSASSSLSPPQREVEVPRTPSSTQRKRHRSAIGLVEGQKMGKLRRVNETIYVAPSPSTRVDDDETMMEA